MSDRAHWVYRCFDAEGRLLYIGFTQSPLERRAAHRSTAPWFDQMARWSLVGPFEGSMARMRAFRCEQRLIATEKPMYNVSPSETSLRGWATRRAGGATRMPTLRLVAGDSMEASA